MEIITNNMRLIVRIDCQMENCRENCKELSMLKVKIGQNQCFMCLMINFLIFLDSKQFFENK